MIHNGAPEPKSTSDVTEWTRSDDGARGASTPRAPEERPSDTTGKAAPCG